jgi:hypothetical protein
MGRLCGADMVYFIVFVHVRTSMGTDPSEWHKQHEEVLRKWCERAQTFRVLHERAYERYERRNMYLMLPVIILTTLAGSANFAQQSLQPYMSNEDIIPFSLGVLNIVATVITALAQFLKVSEHMAAHRSASVEYAKMATRIETELELPRSARGVSGATMIMECRDKLERMVEQIPTPPTDIVRSLARKMRKHYSAMARPDLMALHSVSVYHSPNDPMFGAESHGKSETDRVRHGRGEALAYAQDEEKPPLTPHPSSLSRMVNTLRTRVDRLDAIEEGHYRPGRSTESPGTDAVNALEERRASMTPLDDDDDEEGGGIAGFSPMDTPAPPEVRFVDSRHQTSSANEAGAFPMVSDSSHTGDATGRGSAGDIIV